MKKNLRLSLQAVDLRDGVRLARLAEILSLRVSARSGRALTTASGRQAGFRATVASTAC